MIFGERASFVEHALGGKRLFVELPVSGIEDWVAVVEVLIQEGFKAVAFHAQQVGTVTEALAIFGYRTRIGIWGATSPADVSAAVATGAHFITSPVGDPALGEAAGDVPFLPGGLTPSELRVAAKGGAASASAVQVVPADVMPATYGISLSGLVPGVAFIPCGRLDRYHCEQWFAAGAPAIGLAGVVMDAEASGSASNQPGDVRDRCRSYSGMG